MIKSDLMLDGGMYSSTMTYASDCMKCKFLKDNGFCDAFPDGIPMDIWTAKKHHDKPIKGDHGIQYEKM
jgi:hypothetical protein